MKLNEIFAGRLAGPISKLAEFRIPANVRPSLPGLEKAALWGLIATLALATADLGILYFRDRMLPSQAPPASPFREDIYQPTSRMAFESILTRNAFNADGIIPDASGSQRGGNQDQPVPTSLPIQLVGTLVHSDSAKSVATVALGGGSKIIPYRPGEIIEGVGKVEAIERRKVIFRNRNAYDRLEYAEIKAEGPSMFGLSRSTGMQDAIEVAGNQVTVKRSEVNKQLSNLPELLQQASTVPAMDRTGRIYGFRLVNFASGSIFEKLGLKKFDVIKTVNGESVDSPAKAMELYGQLKSASQLRIGVERDGSDQTIDFSVAEN